MSDKVVELVDSKHVTVVETIVTERLIAKVTLEAQKVELQKQIVEIDEMLVLFI